MITCDFDKTLKVTDSCALLTPAQWLNTPGTCRLRIKNFNPADWSAGCGACVPAGGVTWDGTFPTFNVGDGFYISATTVNVGGKQLVFGIHTAGLFFFGGNWVIQIDCQGGAQHMFDANLAFAAGPVGTYPFNVATCTGILSVDIEAYTP